MNRFKKTLVFTVTLALAAQIFADLIVTLLNILNAIVQFGR
jgi:hypothetical protein